MSIEAMKQALAEAQMLVQPIPAKEVTALDLAKDVSKRAVKLCQLLSQAIATEESSATQEPVACANGCSKFFKYTTQQPKQEQNEPIGEIVVESMGVRGSDAMQVRVTFYKEVPPIGSKIYTHPQPKAEQDLDAICQDLQEKTYTQAMRIADLEKDLSVAYIRGHEDGMKAKAAQEPKREPLLIGKESAEFAKWFNAVWLGDGERGETIPTSGKEYDDYLSQYTLAFGAWMAAKEAAHGIKGEA